MHGSRKKGSVLGAQLVLHEACCAPELQLLRRTRFAFCTMRRGSHSVVQNSLISHAACAESLGKTSADANALRAKLGEFTAEAIGYRLSAVGYLRSAVGHAVDPQHLAESRQPRADSLLDSIVKQQSTLTSAWVQCSEKRPRFPQLFLDTWRNHPMAMLTAILQNFGRRSWRPRWPSTKAA